MNYRHGLHRTNHLVPQQALGFSHSIRSAEESERKKSSCTLWTAISGGIRCNKEPCFVSSSLPRKVAQFSHGKPSHNLFTSCDGIRCRAFFPPKRMTLTDQVVMEQQQASGPHYSSWKVQSTEQQCIWYIRELESRRDQRAVTDHHCSTPTLPLSIILIWKSCAIYWLFQSCTWIGP